MSRISSQAKILASSPSLSEWRERISFGLLLLGIGLIIALLPLKLSAGAVLGCIVFALTLARPIYALYLIVLSVPFGSLASVSVGPMSLTSTELLVASLLLAWLLLMTVNRQKPVRYTVLFWPFLAFFAALALSTNASPSLPLSLKELSKWFEFGAIYLIAVNLIEERSQLRNLAFVIVGAALLESLHGYYQFFRRVGPESFLLGGRFLRAYGTFEQPNPYAGYLGLALPISFGIAIAGSLRPGSPQFWRTALAFGATAAILAAMLMSMSRGAWLGFAAALCVIGSIRSRRSLMALLAISLIGIMFVFMGSLSLLPEQLVGRASQVTGYFRIFDARAEPLTPENWAIVQRMANWQSAWGMFENHPFFGVGIGNFPETYHDYALPKWPEAAGHAHNYYLNLAAETGVVGLTTYLVFYLFAFALAGRVLRQMVASRRLGVPLDLAERRQSDRIPVAGRNRQIQALVNEVPHSNDGQSGRRKAGGLDFLPAQGVTSATLPAARWERRDTGLRSRRSPITESFSWDASANWGLALGLVGVLVALSVHNLFDNLYVHGMSAQIALTLGMLFAAGKVDPNCQNLLTEG